jgi:hypothetical protein
MYYIGYQLEDEMMFLDCPAYLDHEDSVRCGLPAEVEDRYTQGSTGGQLESAKIRCPRGHWFNGPIEFLTWKSTEREASLGAGNSGASHRSFSLNPGLT